MNLELTDEQGMLVDTLRRVFAGADPERLRTVWGVGFLREEYQRLAEMGLLDLVASAADPDDLRLLEVVLLGEVLGRHAAIVPVASAMTLSASLLRAGASPDELCVQLSAGAVWSFASYERADRAFLMHPSCELRDVRDGLRLTGEKHHVDLASEADGFIVTCDGPKGLTVVAVDSAASGVTVSPTQVLGGMPTGRVHFTSAEPIAILSEGSEAARMLEEAWATTMLLQAGYLMGASERLVELTCSHVLERQQFGAQLASFQAVQHHLADCKIALDGARLMVLHTAWLGVHPDRLPLAAETKAWAAEVAADTARWAHELHGGVSVVDEHEVSMLSRRITAESSSYGSPRQLWALAANALTGSLVGVPT